MYDLNHEVKNIKIYASEEANNIIKETESVANTEKIETEKIETEINNNNSDNLSHLSEKYQNEIKSMRKYKGGELEPKWEWVKDISIVYTWVNGSDLNHLDLKSKYNGGNRNIDNRDRSVDELRYSLRSLEKYLPWHRGKIFIVSPNQIPVWLKTDHPRIRVINQDTLLPENVAPTFNTFAIELFLDKIPGISERFIQLNDDYFFKTYTHPSFFFTEDNFYPKFYQTNKPIRVGRNKAVEIANIDNAQLIKKFQGAVFNTNDAIMKAFGNQNHMRWLDHSPYNWYRDLFEPLRQVFKNQIEETISHKFRHPLDIIPPYIMEFFIEYSTMGGEFPEKMGGEGYAKDMGRVELPSHRTITDYSCEIVPQEVRVEVIRFGSIYNNITKNELYFQNLEKSNVLMYNLNDDYKTKEAETQLLNFMKTRYPEKSSFEKEGEEYNIIETNENISSDDISPREKEEIDFLKNYNGGELEPEWEWAKDMSFVYSWVNGSDPQHQNLKSIYNGGKKSEDNRDRSVDELRYSLRSFEKYLPWHRGTVYIVTPNQVPIWLDEENPRIKVINQNDIIPSEAQPTFNSFVIEMYLDKIPGISERFVYLNDDYFFNRYTHPRFFFTKEKFAPKFYQGKKVPYEMPKALEYSMSNNLNMIKKFQSSVFFTNGLIKESFGRSKFIRWLDHSPYSWYRDLFEPARKLFEKEIKETLQHKFRDSLDVIPTYAFQAYVINTASLPNYPEFVGNEGRVSKSKPVNLPENRTIKNYSYDIVSPNVRMETIKFGSVYESAKKNEKLFGEIQNSSVLMFNLNDDYKTNEAGERLANFMKMMYPERSQFEKMEEKDLNDHQGVDPIFNSFMDNEKGIEFNEEDEKEKNNVVESVEDIGKNGVVESAENIGIKKESNEEEEEDKEKNKKVEEEEEEDNIYGGKGSSVIVIDEEQKKSILTNNHVADDNDENEENGVAMAIEDENIDEMVNEVAESNGSYNDDGNENDNSDNSEKNSEMGKVNEELSILNDNEDLSKIKDKEAIDDLVTLLSYRGGELEPEWEWVKNISIVYTWVEGSDPRHLELKSKYNGGDRRVNNRDRSINELRYSIRSLEKFLPWHTGTIYIVSPNQVPYWLDVQHPRVKVINQDDLLPKHVAPTFNSFVIEWYLDKIPGITERFIQLNDDYFFKSYTHPSFFFSKKDFSPKFYKSRKIVRGGRSKALYVLSKKRAGLIKKFHASLFNTNEIIKSSFGEDVIVNWLDHSPYIWYRDLYEPAREVYAPYIQETLSHKFRHPLDIIPTYAMEAFIQFGASSPDFPNKIVNDGQDEDLGPFTLPQNRTLSKYSFEIVKQEVRKVVIKFGSIKDDIELNTELFTKLLNSNVIMYNLNDDYTSSESAFQLSNFMKTQYNKPSSFERIDVLEKEKEEEMNKDTANTNFTSDSNTKSSMESLIYINDMGNPEQEEVDALNSYKGGELEQEWSWASDMSIVYYWVNGTEPEYKALMKQYIEDEKVGNRYDSDKEGMFLKYSIRSIYKYLPWHKGKIFVITPGQQKPYWLNEEYPRVELIDQNELIPVEAQPTFNDFVVEMYMDKIPGISERFVYLNNNHFFNKFIHPRFFFSANDFSPKYYQNKKVNFDMNKALEYSKSTNKDYKRMYLNAVYYTNGVIKDAFGNSYTLRWLYSFCYSFYRDLFQPMRDLLDFEVESSLKYKFRNELNIIPTYAVQAYNMFAAAVPDFPQFVGGDGSSKDSSSDVIEFFKSRNRTVEFYGFDIVSPFLRTQTIKQLSLENEIPLNKKLDDELKNGDNENEKSALLLKITSNKMNAKLYKIFKQLMEEKYPLPK